MDVAAREVGIIVAIDIRKNEMLAYFVVTEPLTRTIFVISVRVFLWSSQDNIV